MRYGERLVLFDLQLLPQPELLPKDSLQGICFGAINSVQNNHFTK